MSLPKRMKWEIYEHDGQRVHKFVEIEGRVYWLDVYGHFSISPNAKRLTEPQAEPIIRAFEAPETLEVKE